MIILDTTVLSEPLRQQASAGVIAWIDRQPLETLFLSVFTVAELRFGILAMPAGKRRAGLAAQVEENVLPRFAGRILPFDMAATLSYAIIMSAARAAGGAIATTDGMIAAIAHSNQMAVAARDTGPFEAAGIRVINPWQT